MIPDRRNFLKTAGSFGLGIGGLGVASQTTAAQTNVTDLQGLAVLTYFSRNIDECRSLWGYIYGITQSSGDKTAYLWYSVYNRCQGQYLSHGGGHTPSISLEGNPNDASLSGTIPINWYPRDAPDSVSVDLEFQASDEQTSQTAIVRRDIFGNARLISRIVAAYSRSETSGSIGGDDVFSRSQFQRGYLYDVKSGSVTIDTLQ